MKRVLLTGILLLLSIPFVQGAIPDADSVSRAASPVLIRETEATLYKTFSIDNLDAEQSVYDPIIVPEIFLTDSTKAKRARAQRLLDKAQERQRFVESLDAISDIPLPVALLKGNAGADYSLLIDRVVYTPQGAVLEAYMSITLPQTGEPIAFHGMIPFSDDGGVVGSAKIYLLGDYPIQINNKILFTIKEGANTFAEIDCDGFRGISIEAEVQFSRELIIPEDAQGNQLPEPNRVKTSFVVYAQSLNDLLVGVNIPPFQIAGLKDVGFSVTQAYMDFSDVANPAGLNTVGHFPTGYTSPFIQAGKPNLWQGFFLQRLEVRLPPAFKKSRNDNTRVSIGVERMILDDLGFSGNIFAEHVLDQGNMNSWSYSLDRVSLELVTNQVRGFNLEGGITMPMVKTKDGKPTQFAYKAQRAANGDYIFAVTIGNELKMGLWAADVKLLPGSSLIVRERDNDFYPSAKLNGELTINILEKTRFNSIRFENMVISSEAPHFQPGTFGFGREGESSKVAGFPLVISKIGGRSEGDRTGIAFDVTVNIGGKADEGGFGGTASLVVWGKRQPIPIKDAEGSVTGTDEGNWEFEKLEVGGVGISVNKPGVFKLAGTVHIFDNDPVYGDGFGGQINGRLGMIKTDFQVQTMFGRTTTFRYWYVDAMVKLDQGIPLAPGMAAYGFGGGYYSKMKQGGGSGSSPSGIKYVPDENTTGIKALMVIGTPERPEPFNGMVTLEVALNRHGGVNKVTLEGNLRFMSGGVSKLMDNVKSSAPDAVQGKALNKLAELMAGQVYGNVLFYFDNVNDIFHGNIEVYVNVAGGLVRGVSSGNKAGWAVLHFEKNDWYILIGTPDQPIGLEVARIFKSKSYFMLGLNLPGSPPPPSQVTEILGPINLDYMRDMNALKSGLGVAFGLHFSVDTGDLTFLMFYARFAAGTGIDFMLKNYGESYHCQGSSGPFGINGWYANGQAYAFVMGKIGIKVKLKFYKGNFDILDIGAAAVLQAKGPNPFWMRGIVGGYYRILGGLVKGQCKFEMTVGKECIPVGEQNLLEGIDMISDMSPVNGSSDVDVFSNPQVAFNIPVGEVFEIKDLEDRKHFFRAVLNEYVVLDGQQPMIGSLNWNSALDVVAFDGRDILPGNKKLKAKVRLKFEERINGQWSIVKFEGKDVVEEREVTFNTGEAPNYIPPNNVELSYPVAGQLNFYPQEYDKGFILLKDGQPYLFKPSQRWTQKLRFTEPTGGQYVEADISYDEAARKVNFNLPSGIQTDKVYRLDVLNIPAQNTVIDANVQKVETELTLASSAAQSADGETSTATLTTKEIEGQYVQLGIETLYSTQFRSSRFSSFGSKLASIRLGRAVRLQPSSQIFQLSSYMGGDEIFDDREVFGDMIKLEANLEGNNWYNNIVYPLVYEGYPLQGRMRIQKRDLALGIPPVFDIYFSNFTNDNPSGSMEELFSAYTGPFVSYEKVVYNVSESVIIDYWDILNQAVNYIVDYPSLSTLRLRKFLTDPIPTLKHGPYKVKIYYNIPGVERQSAIYEWELFNHIPD